MRWSRTQGWGPAYALRTFGRPFRESCRSDCFRPLFPGGWPGFGHSLASALNACLILVVFEAVGERRRPRGDGVRRPGRARRAALLAAVAAVAPEVVGAGGEADVALASLAAAGAGGGPALPLDQLLDRLALAPRYSAPGPCRCPPGRGRGPLCRQVAGENDAGFTFLLTGFRRQNRFGGRGCRDVASEGPGRLETAFDPKGHPVSVAEGARRPSRGLPEHVFRGVLG